MNSCALGFGTTRFLLAALQAAVEGILALKEASAGSRTSMLRKVLQIVPKRATFAGHLRKAISDVLSGSLMKVRDTAARNIKLTDRDQYTYLE